MRFAMKCVAPLLVVLVATTAFGQIVPGDPGSYPSLRIINTPHNLNNFVPAIDIPGNQVCLPCHTPHNALLAGPENVLWNHAETGETFDMYSDAAGQPEGHSKLCLSCHDGVTAVDNYGGSGGTPTNVIDGPKALGTDLSNDHPIGIAYPTSRPTEYNDPASFENDAGVGGAGGVQLITVRGDERVECTSCHAVHNNGLGNFLRVPIQESYLCLQCHIK